MANKGNAFLSFGITGDTDMDDIEYLSIKDFNSKLRSNDSVRTTTGVLATLTANTGKDMYLASAIISCGSTSAGTPSGLYTVQLRVNSVVVETGYVYITGVSDNGWNKYEFAFKGKVTTGQVIDLNVSRAVSVTTTEVSGSIQCFEEDTGTTPQIPPLKPV